MLTEGLLQTLQRVATAVHRLDEVTAGVRELRSFVMERLEKLDDQVAELRERLARLEAARDADHAQMLADVARFKAEVERAELRLTRQLAGGEKPSL